MSLSGAAPQTLQEQIDRLEQKLDRMAQRQEEILAWLGARMNRVKDAQSIYLGDHTALTFLETGQRIYVDTRDIGIGSHLLTFGQWEANYTTVFQRLIKPGQTVFDLGANHGVYTLLGAAATGPGGRVHAFEANPRLANLTRLSAAINGYGEIVTVHPLAVGEAEGIAQLVFDHGWSGGGSLFRGDVAAGGVNEGVACRVAALDALFPDPGFQVQVMKMDIEGAEGRALAGMPRLLERSPDLRLMLEFAPEMLAASGVPAPQVVEFLAARSFRAWLIGADSALTPVAWTSLATTERGVQNILASRDEPI
jgi:FkbM family methyltransferase